MIFNKKLGQNFIYNTGLLNGIIDKLDLKTTDTVVEIGTGPGTLTKVLSPRVKKVITFEVDKTFKDYLEKEFNGFDNIELHFHDVLKRDFDFPAEYKLVANIPYYITSPLIMKFLHDNRCREICILIQHEVANRIVAKSGTGEYSALSVTCQILSNPKIIKKVSRSVFYPVPNVDSAFIVLKKKNHVTLPSNFDKILKIIFAARRKTILNAVKQIVSQAEAERILDECKVDMTMRPDAIPVDKFVQIITKISNSAKK